MIKYLIILNKQKMMFWCNNQLKKMNIKLIKIYKIVYLKIYPNFNMTNNHFFQI